MTRVEDMVGRPESNRGIAGSAPQGGEYEHTDHSASPNGRDGNGSGLSVRSPSARRLLTLAKHSPGPSRSSPYGVREPWCPPRGRAVDAGFEPARRRKPSTALAGRCLKPLGQSTSWPLTVAGRVSDTVVMCRRPRRTARTAVVDCVVAAGLEPAKPKHPGYSRAPLPLGYATIGNGIDGKP